MSVGISYAALLASRLSVGGARSEMTKTASRRRRTLNWAFPGRHGPFLNLVYLHSNVRCLQLVSHRFQPPSPSLHRNVPAR
jgi:hypothetical protein